MATAEPTVQEMERYIRKVALREGIDPDTMVRVAKTEGLGKGIWQSNIGKGTSNREASFGPFQFYMGGGLGNQFQRSTGLDPRDKSTWKQQIDYTAKTVKKVGWTPFHGARDNGIDQWEGIRSPQADLMRNVRGVLTSQPLPSEQMAKAGSYESESPTWQKILEKLDADVQAESGSSGESTAGADDSDIIVDMDMTGAGVETDDGGPLAVVLGALDTVRQGFEDSRKRQKERGGGDVPRIPRGGTGHAPTIGQIERQAGG